MEHQLRFHFMNSFKNPILFINLILHGLTIHHSGATVTVIRAICTPSQTWTPAFSTIQNWCMTCLCLIGNTSVCRANIGITQIGGQCGTVAVVIPAATTTARPAVIATTAGQVVIPPVTAPTAAPVTTAPTVAPVVTTTSGQVVVPPVTPAPVVTTTGGQVVTTPITTRPTVAATTMGSGVVIINPPVGPAGRKK